jgi:hypothetical protein
MSVDVLLDLHRLFAVRCISGSRLYCWVVVWHLSVLVPPFQPSVLWWWPEPSSSRCLTLVVYPVV